MKLKRHPKNPILTNDHKVSWEAGSVFNPCVIKDEKVFHMFYRATNALQIGQEGGYISSIGHAYSSDGINFIKDSEPFITPTEYYEIGKGCEDARVAKLGDTYYIFYTAVEGIGPDKKVRIALATSKNLKDITKHGIVGPAGSISKAACIFPEKINGKIVMVYTWEPDRPISTIMQVEFEDEKSMIKPSRNTYGDNLESFDQNYFLQPLNCTFRGPEVGAVPIKTEKGWLVIYCGTAIDKPIWTIDALIVDLVNTKKILGISNGHLLYPETKDEKFGVYNDVAFPSGAVVVGDELYVYYGSGDQGCCLATGNLNKLIDEILSNPPTKDNLGKQYNRQLTFL